MKQVEWAKKSLAKAFMEPKVVFSALINSNTGAWTHPFPRSLSPVLHQLALDLTSAREAIIVHPSVVSLVNELRGEGESEGCIRKACLHHLEDLAVDCIASAGRAAGFEIGPRVNDSILIGKSMVPVVWPSFEASIHREMCARLGFALAVKFKAGLRDHDAPDLTQAADVMRAVDDRLKERAEAKSLVGDAAYYEY